MTEHELAELARSRGLLLRRSSVTDPAVPGYGVYWLLDARTGLQVWPDRWGAELEQIGEWLELAEQQTSTEPPA